MRLMFARKNQEKIGEEGKSDTLQPLLYQGLHLVAVHLPERNGDARAEIQKQRRENYKNGRERPHFLGFKPPKKFLESLPPCGTSNGAGSFPTAAKNGF
jgi:hypothetical protein